MTTRPQKVGQRFLSTRLSADKFSCITGRQSNRYVKKNFDLQSLTCLPYFPTQISPLVGTSAQIDWALHKIIIWVRMMQSSRLERACVLELLRSCFVFELVTLHCERTFTWVYDTYCSKVIISTKFANSCQQSSIKSGKCKVDYLMSLNILLRKLWPPHLNRK